MSEATDPSAERFKQLEVEYQDWLETMDSQLREVSEYVEHNPNPPQGIAMSIDSDVFGVKTIASEGFQAAHVTMSLHEQESEHQVWDIDVTGFNDHNPTYIWSMFIKSPSGMQLLVSPNSDTDRPHRSSFVPATHEQAGLLVDEVVGMLQYQAKMIAFGFECFGFDSPYDKNARADFEHHMKDIQESGITIPGLVDNGVILIPSPYYNQE